MFKALTSFVVTTLFSSVANADINTDNYELLHGKTELTLDKISYLYTQFKENSMSLVDLTQNEEQRFDTFMLNLVMTVSHNE